MASRFALLLLSPFLIATSFCYSVADAVPFEGEDPLIRRVVDHKDDKVAVETELLGADHHFTIFKQKFGKSYPSQEEHDYRLSVFKANLRRARRHQKLDPSALHGVIQYSDLTPHEFPFDTGWGCPARNTAIALFYSFVQNLRTPVNETLEANFTGSHFVDSEGKDRGFTVGMKADERNGSHTVKNTILVDDSGNRTELEVSYFADSVDNVTSASVSNKESGVGGYPEGGNVSMNFKASSVEDEHNSSGNGEIGNCQLVYENQRMSYNLFMRMSERDVVSSTCMMKCFLRVGELDRARRLFAEMMEKDTVSWTVMIKGYLDHGKIKSAQELFDKMPHKDIAAFLFEEDQTNWS